jgi:hypothetical protein
MARYRIYRRKFLKRLKEERSLQRRPEYLIESRTVPVGDRPQLNNKESVEIRHNPNGLEPCFECGRSHFTVGCRLN